LMPVLKQALRSLDARAEHIAPERHADRFFETVREMVLAQTELAGEVRQRQIIRGAKLDRLHQLLDREIQDIRRGAVRQKVRARGAPVAVWARRQNPAQALEDVVDVHWLGEIVTDAELERGGDEQL